MPRQPWSDEELAALRAIAPGDRAALAAFRARFPRRSRTAVVTKLAVLRCRLEAADTVRRPRRDWRLRQRPPETVVAPDPPSPGHSTPEDAFAAAMARAGHDFGSRSDIG